jgi:hypothetical protein
VGIIFPEKGEKSDSSFSSGVGFQSLKEVKPFGWVGMGRRTLVRNGVKKAVGGKRYKTGWGAIPGSL